MKVLVSLKQLLTIILFTVSATGYVTACSMYKVTSHGKTWVGTNEDAWRTTPHIWFENGQSPGFGCVFTGSRVIGKDRYAPQSGMNTKGLSFSRLASWHPEERHAEMEHRKKITDGDQFLTDVLHHCGNVQEVRAYFERYDYSYFLDEVLLYVDSTGHYLIVEPYSLTIGSDPAYVIANFCPSITNEADRRKMDRYRVGSDALKGKLDSSLAFCRDVSWKMHVCRDKIGDGTLLTTIRDLQEGVVYVYFYHEYDHVVSFRLANELAKGDHQLDLVPLFPPNKEFEQLKSYVTPYNTPLLRAGFAVLGLLFGIFALLLLISFFRGVRRGRQQQISKMWVALVFVLATWYLFLLDTQINIFYFPAPYVDRHSMLISVSSYIPWVLLAAFVSIVLLHVKYRFFRAWPRFLRIVLYSGSLWLGLLIPLFFYWRLMY